MSRRGWLRAMFAVAASLMATAPAGAASATSSSASATATFTIGVRSVTVSLKPMSRKGICTTGLLSGGVSVQLGPAAHCSVPVGVIVVTNGTVPAHVDVVGAPALAADEGSHPWTLCGGSGPVCTGESGAPGVDQFKERTTATVRAERGRPTVHAERATTTVFGPPLTVSYQCDDAFAPTARDACLASVAQVADEGLSEQGPSSSSTATADHVTVVSWMASP